MSDPSPMVAFLDRADEIGKHGSQFGVAVARTLSQKREICERYGRLADVKASTPGLGSDFASLCQALDTIRADEIRALPTEAGAVQDALSELARLVATWDRQDTVVACLQFSENIRARATRLREAVAEAKARILPTRWKWAAGGGAPKAMSFIETVRDEVRYAADAKRQQFARGYSNDTLASMIVGIEWAEASQQLDLLTDLPADAVEQVARVMRRELTVGTVEQVADLLEPAVRRLRDAWEERRGAAATGRGMAESNATAGQGELTEVPRGTSTRKRAKRSTERGEGRAKLIAALTKHHKYADGGCLNEKPIGNNELARLAEVSESTASAFFKQHFKGHTKYRAICADAIRLVATLKLLNNEFAPHHLFGAKPPGEDDREEE